MNLGLWLRMGLPAHRDLTKHIPPNDRRVWLAQRLWDFHDAGFDFIVGQHEDAIRACLPPGMGYIAGPPRCWVTGEYVHNESNASRYWLDFAPGAKVLNGDDFREDFPARALQRQGIYDAGGEPWESWAWGTRPQGKVSEFCFGPIPTRILWHWYVRRELCAEPLAAIRATCTMLERIDPACESLVLDGRSGNGTGKQPPAPPKGYITILLSMCELAGLQEVVFYPAFTAPDATGKFEATGLWMCDKGVVTAGPLVEEITAWVKAREK